jgi:hypothetical protein
MNRHFNPDDMIAPMAVYSHGVEVPAGARTVYVAGRPTRRIWPRWGS